MSYNVVIPNALFVIPNALFVIPNPSLVIQILLVLVISSAARNLSLPFGTGSGRNLK